MKTLFIFLDQSQTGMILEIVLLLVVAGLIGYLTAYFYYKSVYTPVIAALEKDKENLLAETRELKTENDQLIKKLSDRENEIKELKNPGK